MGQITFGVISKRIDNENTQKEYMKDAEFSKVTRVIENLAKIDGTYFENRCIYLQSAAHSKEKLRAIGFLKNISLIRISPVLVFFAHICTASHGCLQN